MVTTAINSTPLPADGTQVTIAEDAHRIRNRNPHLDWGADVPLLWHGTKPEFACAANAVSLLMPHVEPFVVRFPSPFRRLFLRRCRGRSVGDNLLQLHRLLRRELARDRPVPRVL